MNELIDRLITFFTSDTFKEEVAKAKKDFFDESGVMDEENQDFEMRMTQFLGVVSLYTRTHRQKYHAGIVRTSVARIRDDGRRAPAIRKARGHSS